MRVAIIEANTLSGTSAIASANPFVGPVTFYNPTHTVPSQHATQVAGIIASTNVTYRGVSHGVARPTDLLSGNSVTNFDSDLNAATGWAAAAPHNASVINQSYRDCPSSPSSLGAMAKFDDYIVGLYLPTIAVCAGNDCGLFVANPAVGFNVIAVGIPSNNNSNWGDDPWALYSAYKSTIPAWRLEKSPRLPPRGKCL